MIVVDTSALVAILLREPLAAACRAVLEDERSPLISAGTVAESLIVAGQRGFASQMSGLLAALDVQTIPVTASFARKVADAYGHWGQGGSSGPAEPRRLLFLCPSQGKRVPFDPCRQ